MTRRADGEVRREVVAVFERRPRLSDADVAAILTRRGMAISQQAVNYHRRRAGIPNRRERKLALETS